MTRRCWYNEAIRLDPQYPNSYWGRGETHYELGQYSEAVADYRQYEAANGVLEPFMVDRILEMRLPL